MSEVSFWSSTLCVGTLPGDGPAKLAMPELRLVYADALESYLAVGPEGSLRQECMIAQRVVAPGSGFLKILSEHRGWFCKIT